MRHSIRRLAALSFGAALLWGVSYIYVAYGQVPWIAAIFYGLKPAVMGIIS